MHRRRDRDRYLLVAEEGESECRRRFLEKCPDRDGIPAQLGPFDFSSPMFAQPAPSRESCEADHDLVPYVARGLSEAACGWIKGDGVSGISYNGEIAELYAMRQAGFRPYAAIGKDLGPSAPLQIEPAPGQTLRGLALVAAPDGGLTALALAGFPPEQALHVVESATGVEWGEWRELTRNLPEPDSLYGPEVVRRAPTSSIVDVTFFNERAVFHATTDISSGKTTSWTTLGAPGGTSVLSSVVTTINAAGGLALYAYAASLEPEFAGIYRRELEGADDWSDWQEVPLVTSGSVDLAAVTTEQGTEHLAIAAASSIFYGARAADGVWSAWTELNPIAPPALNPWGAQAGTIAILPGQHEPLGLLWQSSEHLWYSTCFASPCTEATSWTRPNALAASGAGLSAVVGAEHIDIVTSFVEVRPQEEPSGNMYFTGLWHKRGPLPLTAKRIARAP
jgi:hypothetical protein